MGRLQQEDGELSFHLGYIHSEILVLKIKLAKTKGKNKTGKTLAGKRRQENRACRAVFGYIMSSGKVWAV